MRPLLALTLASLLTAACDGDVVCAESTDGDPSETTDDSTDGGGINGYCCKCGSNDPDVGIPLKCTPTSEDKCEFEGFAWCELDSDGNASACEQQCGE